MNEKNDIVKLNTTATKVTREGNVWVVDLPRFSGDSGTHHHTLGLLTPYFKGLIEGKLMATKCINDNCPISRGKGELWLPPRADCPDCHQRMKWKLLPNPVIGKIYTFTEIGYSGEGIELSTPYYQIDVRIPGVITIPKGYLLYGEPYIGMEVKAQFRTKNPTNTILDLYWVPLKKK